MYQRKTVDVWWLYINYGQGWEQEVGESTYREIRQRRKEYADNCPQYPTRIRCKRERIEANQVSI